jgi:hypothetical protein
VTSSKARQQDSQAAERENTPRLRSAPCPHAGQTRRSALETLICLTECPSLSSFFRAFCTPVLTPISQRGAYVGIRRATSPAEMFHPGDSAEGSYPLTTSIHPVASLRLGPGLGWIPPVLVHSLHVGALQLHPDFYASDYRFALLAPHQLVQPRVLGEGVHHFREDLSSRQFMD